MVKRSFGKLPGVVRRRKLNLHVRWSSYHILFGPRGLFWNFSCATKTAILDVWLWCLALLEEVNCLLHASWRRWLLQEVTMFEEDSKTVTIYQENGFQHIRIGESW